MLRRAARRTGFGLFLAVTLITLAGCKQQSSAPLTQSVPKQEEAQPQSSPLPPQETPEIDAKEMAKLPPPKPAEVESVTRRVFKDAALLDTSQKPYFFLGDFNGDHSQDIVVVLKPASGKLSEMNQEYPPWMLRDPFNPTLPPQLRKEPFRVEESDTLMAVIHGEGPKGWRNPEATQTYLLKNAVGTGINSQPARASVAAYAGKKTPALMGDTIAEVIGGRTGFLYYSGASYAWYDPKTYKAGSERRMAHTGAPMPR